MRIHRSWPRSPEPRQASAGDRSTEDGVRVDRLLVLTAHPGLYSPRRLAESAARLALPVELRRPAESAALAPGRPGVLARPGSFSFLMVLRAQRRLAGLGARPLQSRRALLDACDQGRTLARAERAGLPIPRTVLVRRPADVAAVLERIPGPPWFVKGRRGSQGTQVMLAIDELAAIRAAHLFWGTGSACLVQQDLREHGPIERHLVVGDRVLASALARTAPGEFRSNVHRGGRLEAIDAGATDGARIAVAAAAALDLPYAGVDVIGGRDPVLLEVNASPGLQGIERATGRDLALPLLATLLGYAAGA